MTLEECDDLKKQSMMHSAQSSSILVAVLKQAQAENRLVTGMYEAAKCLSSSSQDVALCILPQNHLNDVAQHINHMLVEAFCNEHDICILKVDCEEKLAKLLLSGNHTNNNNTSTKGERNSNDFSCILVQENKNVKNYEVDKLRCWQEMRDTDSPSIIELPVQ